MGTTCRTLLTLLLLTLLQISQSRKLILRASNDDELTVDQNNPKAVYYEIDVEKLKKMFKDGLGEGKIRHARSSYKIKRSHNLKHAKRESELSEQNEIPDGTKKLNLNIEDSPDLVKTRIINNPDLYKEKNNKTNLDLMGMEFPANPDSSKQDNNTINNDENENQGNVPLKKKVINNEENGNQENSDEFKNLVTKLKESCVCPLKFEPVCDTDGITHPNSYCVKCRNNNPNVRIAHQGPCDPQEVRIKKLTGFAKSPYTNEEWPFPCYCPHVQALICDSDGVTHYNIHCMKCYKPRGVISRDGPCDDKDPRHPNYKD